jgi:murein DD-endopeptidase MepM/ murein hydrolase activator NlpD
MRREEQLGWPAAGAVSVAVLAGRRKRSESVALGSPLEAVGTPVVTPHGYFRAHREGPPAHWHQGVDLSAAACSRVLAIGDGSIVATDPGLGKIVRKLRLDTPGSWGGVDAIDAVVYADLGLTIVEPGKRVHKGDVIAFVAPAGFVHLAVKQKTAHGETFIDLKAKLPTNPIAKEKQLARARERTCLFGSDIATSVEGYTNEPSSHFVPDAPNSPRSTALRSPGSAQALEPTWLLPGDMKSSD